MEDNENRKLPSNAYTDIKPLNRDISTAKEKTASDNEKRGHVQAKKKTIGERIADSFLATDGHDIGEYLVFDLFVPAVKSAIENVVHMILFGSAGANSQPRRGDGTRIRRLEYDEMYRNDPRRKRDEYISRRTDRRPELIFSRRSDAEQVRNGMFEYIDDYGRATLKNFYNMVAEVTDGEIDIPTDYTMTSYGWYSFAGSDVVAVRGGYLLKVPKAEVL